MSFENLRVNLFEDEVLVFTLKGDVKSLPAGATPADFAYTAHATYRPPLFRCESQQPVGAPRLQVEEWRMVVQILTANKMPGPAGIG